MRCGLQYQAEHQFCRAARARGMPTEKSGSTEPVLPADAAVLVTANALNGPALVAEDIAARGANGRGVAALGRFGFVASIGVHLLLVLWAVGLFASAQTLPQDEVIPIILVPDETPPAPEVVPDDIDTPASPMAQRDPTPPPPAKIAEGIEPDDTPAPNTEKNSAFLDALASFGFSDFSKTTTLSEVELHALTVQAKRCWNIPAEWTNSRQVSVTVRFRLNRDGTVTGTPTVVEFPATEIGKTAADDAVRAVIQCGPFDLPSDKYEQWNDVQLRFEP